LRREPLGRVRHFEHGRRRRCHGGPRELSHLSHCRAPRG
jgi:hypothetical protein